MKLREIVNPAGTKVECKCKTCNRLKMMRPGTAVCDKCKGKTREAARLRKLAAVPGIRLVSGGLPSLGKR